MNGRFLNLVSISGFFEVPSEISSLVFTRVEAHFAPGRGLVVDSS